jgi:hypothetical protein
MRNLKMFKGKTDEDIVAYLRNRAPKPSAAENPSQDGGVPPVTIDEYDQKFKKKLKLLQTEYGIDMNDANDADALRSLVRLGMQLEAVDAKIRTLHKTGDIDSRTLKNLGDYQRSVQMSITDLQDRLGIARKQRKEKQVDDIPKYIEALQDRAKNFWERQTVPIRCERDQIELARLWINFPKLNNSASFELECWKCHERVLHTF